MEPPAVSGSGVVKPTNQAMMMAIADDGQRAGHDQALVERLHDAVVRAELDEVGADDRGQDADRADAERQHHQRVAHRAGEEDRREQHGGDDRDRVGLEQVGGHAGAVADVVADVVGDHGGVAGIVLGDAGLDLADQVGADIGALGEDAAAEPGEDGDQRGAEAERDHRLQHRAQRRRSGHAGAQDEVVAGDAEQAEPDHQHAR